MAKKKPTLMRTTLWATAAKEECVDVAKATVGSWQITSRTLIEAVVARGAVVKRAFDAKMRMKKTDAAAIDAARPGEQVSS